MTRNNMNSQDELEVLANLLAISCKIHENIGNQEENCSFIRRDGQCPVSKYHRDYGCIPVRPLDWLEHLEKLEKHAKKIFE